MAKVDLTIRIAGENGEGVLTVGDVLAEALARSGLHIYTFKNLPAEIKGGASMVQVRVGDTLVRSPSDAIDILMSWNQENYDAYIGELRPGGVVIYDPGECEADESRDAQQVAVPLQSITKEIIKVMKSKNVLAFGVLTACIGVPFEIGKRMVEESRWGNGSYSPNCRCPRVTTTGGGPVHCKGSKTALATVSGFPGISLAHRKRPQYWRRPGSPRSGVAGNWPLGSPTT